MMMDFCIFHTVEKIHLVKNLYLVNIYMYKSTTGLQTFKGCPLRLREISVQRNRGPTTLKGGEVSLGNAIRRRVARISKNSARHEKVKDSYGPLFGLKKAPYLGGNGKNCESKALYSANSGNSSDVIYWRKLYGGSRLLFDTNSCSYGCCEDSLFEKDENCVCFEIEVTSDRKPENGDTLTPGDSLTVVGGLPTDNIIVNTVTVNTTGTANTSSKKYKLKLRVRKFGILYKFLSNTTTTASVVLNVRDLIDRDRYIPVRIIEVDAPDNGAHKPTDC